MEDIPVYTPTLGPYKNSVKQAINSEWISCHGEYKEKVTQQLKDFLGVERVLLTSNGTTATHCLFIALKYRHPNIRKIYVPNHVYVAAVNSALFEYPLEMLEMLETDESSWNMRTDKDYLMSLDPESAILVVHNIGNVINVPRIKRLRPDIIIIEDNCEGLFGTYEGVYSGCSKGVLCSSISFFANKTITSGEGGAVVIPDDKELADMLSRKISQGMTPEKYLHDMVAYNYRMTNIEAAFLHDQLQDVETIIASKKLVYSRYRSHLQKFVDRGQIAFQRYEAETTHSNWMFPIRIFGNPDYNTATVFLKERGIDTRPFFYKLTRHKHLRDISFTTNDNELSQTLENEIVILPSYPALSEPDIIRICGVLGEYLSFLEKGEYVHIQELSESKKLESFVQNSIPEGEKSFRYFKTRSIDICDSHVLTLTAVLKGEVVGYGHLDPEGDRVWLGVCVADRYCGKDIGKRILKQLIDFADIKLLELHLSVDSSNAAAIHLYTIFGFDFERELGDKRIMVRKALNSHVQEAEITVPVSIGEAVDKYTILEIKEAKIKDEKKLAAVIKEKTALSENLQVYLREYAHYVKVLRDINEQIWDDQDRFRESSDALEQGQICTKIIKDNDGRFRVKNKINSLVHSKFKEQKSYAQKRCLLLGHLGMGDMITMIGAVRYLSIYYDEVLVVVFQKYAESVRLMYKDDPSITFLEVEDDKDISPAYGCDPTVLESYSPRYEILKCGFHKGSLKSLSHFYKQFYTDIGLDWSVRVNYGHVHRNLTEELRVYQEVTKHHPTYIFVHDYPSHDISSKLIYRDELVFNVNRNAYSSSHTNYFVWDKHFAKENLCHFGHLLEHAEEIHVADSAFFCYCAYLDLSRVKKCVVYVRSNYYNVEDYINPNATWEIRK